MARTQVIKNCLNCGREFSRRLHKGREHLYCSQDCYHDHYKPVRQDPSMLFWSKVDKNGSGGCWLWQASTRGKDYGAFRFNGKNEAAHRVAWMLIRGSIPNGQHVLHHCDVPLCVNAESHLWIGSNEDNVADKMRKGRGGHLRGNEHPNTLISDAEVEEIRSASGQTISALSRHYGVSRMTIKRLLTGQSRKRAPLPTAGKDPK